MHLMRASTAVRRSPNRVRQAVHKVRRLEFSAGLGGLPPNQSSRIQNRKARAGSGPKPKQQRAADNPEGMKAGHALPPGFHSKGNLEAGASRQKRSPENGAVSVFTNNSRKGGKHESKSYV